MSVLTVRLVRLVGDAVFCLFGNLDLTGANTGDVGGSRNRMILFASVIGYEKAMNSCGSRSERIL